MIHLEEGNCKDIPGISSLFVTLEFNQSFEQIIKVIKGCDVYKYNKKTKIWELPVTNLSYLIDNLAYLDDIDIKLLPTKTNAFTRRTTALEYKLKPFDYQYDGILYGINNKKWLLLDAPGLGKTAQIIHIAEELHHQDGLKHCLIICGINTLKTNWKKEIAKHSDLTCTILGEKVNSKGKVRYESVAKRAEQLQNKIEEFFIITNIETFRNEDVLNALQTSDNNIDMVIVDEIHKCKSHNSQQGKNLLKITKPNYKIAATGTMILNNPLDTYVPLSWLGLENSNFTTFKTYYCKTGGAFGNSIIGFRNMNVLKKQITDNSLRRTKDLLDLPPKTIINEIVDMNDAQKKFYEDITNGIKTEVDKVKLTTSSLLAMVTRLRQATAYPSTLTSSPIESSKLERCCDLVEQIVSNGDKVVVFSTYKDSIYHLEKQLAEYKPLVITGDTDDDITSEYVDTFQDNEDNKLILATWQKAGTGLTLTKASYMIFIDTPWTYSVFEQACDRIYRIGTEKSVFIYNLICKDTIDERVLNILETKKAISDYVIDDNLDENSISSLRSYIEGL